VRRRGFGPDWNPSSAGEARQDPKSRRGWRLGAAIPPQGPEPPIAFLFQLLLKDQSEAGGRFEKPLLEQHAQPRPRRSGLDLREFVAPVPLFQSSVLS
jgi:hypothetical protein